MKTSYIQPELQIIDLQEFSVICGSPTEGVDGGFTDLTLDDDSDYFVN